ncbi:MAG TPA: LysM peptidoglycan-binding domain-containing protein, partial [Anaerolineae bacterium]|nr:LysM peptidoglycan-binding domain-containing protein [Anaerolineae bacterium]
PEPTVTPSPPPTQSTAITHTVQPGDNLLGLARQYGVPMAAIQLQNRMGDSTTLYAGQVLTIPVDTGWEGASPYWIVHIVSEGETLAGIGRAYGLDVEMLETVNRLTDADLIHVGQELVLPLDAPVVMVAPTPTWTVAPPPSPSPTPVPPPAALPPSDIAAWPHELVRLINQTRASYGLPPLAYNDALTAAAQGQANDCAQRGWCSHTGSDGSDVKTRILRAGYEATGWAECWAQSLNPQHAVDMWMDEVPPNDPHRRTLLSTWLTEIGVGVADTGWGYYFIADFGRP